MKKLFGVTVAMVTPFDSNDHVDINALSALTNMLITKGVFILVARPEKCCVYPHQSVKVWRKP